MKETSYVSIFEHLRCFRFLKSASRDAAVNCFSRQSVLVCGRRPVESRDDTGVCCCTPPFDHHLRSSTIFPATVFTVQYCTSTGPPPLFSRSVNSCIWNPRSKVTMNSHSHIFEVHSLPHSLIMTAFSVELLEIIDHPSYTRQRRFSFFILD